MSIAAALRRIPSLSATLLVAVALLVPPSASAAGRLPGMSAEFRHDITRLDPGAAYSAFVHFAGGSELERATYLAARGITVATDFGALDVAYAIGRVAAFGDLTDDPGIAYLEADRKLTYLGDTGPWASRARVAQLPVSGGPYADADGLDGSGIGVAIVDSGINGLHPDLAARTAKNYKIVCSTPGLINTTTQQCFGPLVFAEAPYTDTTSGHGTHVAGIVAGEGTESRGTFTGVAPGASLYGYSTGEVISVLFAAEAFQHIIDNFDNFNPRIRVVNNSWGDPAGTAYNPNSILSKLTKQLVDKGVTMVYAAGNDGGAGSADETSSTCKDPTPGVVCVANYDDAGTGTRTGGLNSSSSRGRSGQANTYPDVAAPGTSITSACIREAQPVCNAGVVDEARWAPWYATISGTSMAAPHVAGIAALLLEADPSLTPAALEDVLQDSARKIAFGAPYENDPQNPGGSHSFDKGAGLVDVPAALNALGIPAMNEPSPAQVVFGDGGDYPAQGAADLVGLTVTEEETGMRYAIQVRDVEDLGPTTIPVRVTQNVDGRNFLTTVTITSSGVTIPAPGTSNNAPATEAARDVAADTVSFFVPFSNLGNPGVNAPGHNVFISSFVGAIVDVAPGGPGADVLARPRFGAAYTIRPALIEPDPTQSPTPTSTPTQSPSSSATPTPTPTSSATPEPEGDVVFEGEGFIEISGPIGVTQGDFIVTCAEPTTQGLDGYVFELPQATSAREVATLVGSDSLIPHDLDLYFYDSACVSSGDAAATVAPDEIAFVPPGTKWILAHAFTGLQTTATLTVYEGETSLEPPPVALGTTVEFTSAGGGNYGDEATIAARLTDENGNAIEGAELAFELTGEDGVERWTATTDSEGVGSTTRTLTGAPGTYNLTVNYAGETDVYEPDSDQQFFVIDKEQTVTTLDVTGKGKNRTLTASLTEDDGPTLGGREIVYYADGTEIGRATTNTDGIAVLEAPPGYRGGRFNFEARFAGTENYRESSGSYQT